LKQWRHFISQRNWQVAMALVLKTVVLLMVFNCRYKGFGFPVTKINCLLIVGCSLVLCSRHLL